MARKGKKQAIGKDSATPHRKERIVKLDEPEDIGLSSPAEMDECIGCGEFKTVNPEDGLCDDCETEELMQEW